MQKNNLLIPIAIVVAGALIAGAVYLGTRGTTSGARQPQDVAQQTGDLERMKPITKDDHIRGNPNSPVCRIFGYRMPVLQTIPRDDEADLDEYGDDKSHGYTDTFRNQLPR